MNNFQERIAYSENLEPLLIKVSEDFKIGKYLSYKVVLMGYEDFNLMLETNKGKFFVKIFRKFRNKKECSRYVNVIENVLKAGVSHPFLYKSSQGYLYQIKMSKIVIRLCVMEYIDGKTFYELKKDPTNEEMKSIIKQVALINKLKIKPDFEYDIWSITNFLEQYDKKAKYLDKDDKKLIAPLVQAFKALSKETLPHCFVHGDITKTNTMIDKNRRIYLLDFAVSNYYPRTQELAVLLCDLLSKSNYQKVVNEYQKYIKLTRDEINRLPLYLKFAHAMHVLCGTYEKVVNENNSVENEYFIKIGRAGLRSFSNSLVRRTQALL